MTLSYNILVVGSWAVFIAVWILAAFGVKRDIRGGGVASVWYRYFILRLALVVLFVYVDYRIAVGAAHFAGVQPSLLRDGFFTPPLALGWLGAALTVVGVLFAIWARMHLGANWSPAPAVKEHHELVTSGPYRFVRHPIYTGALLAAFGTALTGTVFGVCTFAIVAVIFLLHIGTEENIMLELFPNEYPAYQARAKKLIPFVW